MFPPETRKILNSAPRQPFIGLVSAAAVGILVADYYPNPSLASLAIFGILSATALFTHSSLTVYASIAVGFFILHSFHTGNSPGARLAREFGQEPRPITVQGSVISDPKIAASGTASFCLESDSIEMDGVTRHLHLKFLVRWRGVVELGDEVSLFGTAEQVDKPRNPGEFNMRAFIARQEVYRFLIVRYPENGIILKHGGGNPILRAARKARDWMQVALSRDLERTPEVVGAIQGMVLGLRHQTADDIEEPFQQTGTLHLFAVAGLHVGIVARLLWIMATTSRLPRRWATSLIIPALLFYAAVTGLHISSVRAAVMSGAFLAGIFAERKIFPINNLAAAATLILGWDTNELFSVGFQLSFSVVAAIVLLADPAYRLFRRPFAPDPFLPRNLFGMHLRLLGYFGSWLARAGSVSFAAWIGSLPLMITYYSLITPISLVANLVVVPIAFFVLACGLMSLVSAPISTGLSITFNNTNWFLTQIILGSVQFFGQIPAGHLYVDHSPSPPGVKIEINILDLKAGAAIHIRTRGGDWLIDGGTAHEYHRVIRQYLRFRGIDHLAGFVLTHGDAAHAGGAGGTLSDFHPVQFVDTAAPDRSRTHRQLISELFQNGYSRRLCAAGDQLDFSSDVTAKVLFPPKGFAARRVDDQTLVLQLEVLGESRALLTSDSGSATETYLLKNYPALQSDFIIKGQHHSGDSGSAAFLDSVHPRAIVATSRDFPKNEHLTDEWVEGLRFRGIKLFRQDETGAVRIRVFEHYSEIKAFVTGETFRSARP